jgi:DNA-directed RNA polymerase specialized sigma24 family protein
MRDEQGFMDFASAQAGHLRRQAYLLTGSPERAVRLADKALADTGRRWDKLGGGAAAEEYARRVLASGAVRGRGVAPTVAVTARGTATPTDDTGEAVRRALAGLPPRRRAVLVLRYDEGLDDAAVGARLGVPASAAAAEGEAGLSSLRSLLRRRGRPEDLLPAALAETPIPAPLTHVPHPVAPTPLPTDIATPVESSATASVPAPGSPETALAPAEPASPATAASATRPAAAVVAVPEPATTSGGSAPGSAGRERSLTAPESPPATPSAGQESAAPVDTPRPAAAEPETSGSGSTAAPANGRPGRGRPGGGRPADGRQAIGGSENGRPGDGQQADGGSENGRPENGWSAAGTGSAAATTAAAETPSTAGTTPTGEVGPGDRVGRGRRRWIAAAVLAVVVGVGAGILVPALRDGSAGVDGPLPAAAGTAPALLPWPARGPLAGDQDLLRSALRAWSNGVPDRRRPARSATLWAGDLDGVRTVLLQGTDPSGQSWLAQVIGSGDTASLRSTEPLGRAVPLLAVGTTAGAVRLLADPAAAPDSILAAVGDSLRPLSIGRDGLSQGVTAPSAGLRVVLTAGGAVMGSGTVLPGRLSPVTGTVELTRSTLDLGPAQPPVQAWFDDGVLVGRRLGGPVELVQVGPARAASIRVNGRATRLEARAYEVVRGGGRYLATVVRAGGAPACTDTAPVGPADSVPAKPVALVARCIPRGTADGVLAAVGTRGVRFVLVTLAPATRAAPGRPGVAPRPARPARTVTITGTSGAGLVGLTAVSALPTGPVPAVVRDSGNHQLAGVTLPAYRGPHA